MDDQLRVLLELQKLDSSMLALRLCLDSIPAQASSASATLKEVEKAYETARQHQQSLEKKKRELELRVEELQDKIAKIRGRSKDIKKNEEYQAHLKEIEANEADIRAVEDQILSLMESIEAAASCTAEAKRRLDAEKGNEDIARKERDAETMRSEEDLKAIKEQRKALAAGVEADIYNMYMTLLKTCRGLAVVEAKNEICGGCNLHIPPQLFVQIKAGGDLFQCPQCRRILYYDKPQQEVQDQSAPSVQ